MLVRTMRADPRIGLVVAVGSTVGCGGASDEDRDEQCLDAMNAVTAKPERAMEGGRSLIWEIVLEALLPRVAVLTRCTESEEP